MSDQSAEIGIRVLEELIEGKIKRVRRKLDEIWDEDLQGHIGWRNLDEAQEALHQIAKLETEWSSLGGFLQHITWMKKDIEKEKGKKEEHPDSSSPELRYDIEFRHNHQDDIDVMGMKFKLPEYEIAKWDGNHNYTVAIYRHNDKEPCWYLESVGDRMVGLNPEELMSEIEKGFSYLENITGEDES